MDEQTQTSSIQPAPPPIKVRIESGTAEKSEYLFTHPFRCGRDKSCEVRLSDTAVSRFHAEFWYSNGHWWILDLQSANGSFLNGRRIERAQIATLARVQLGGNGPVLLLTVENVPVAESTSTTEAVKDVTIYNSFVPPRNVSGDSHFGRFPLNAKLFGNNSQDAFVPYRVGFKDKFRTD